MVKLSIVTQHHRCLASTKLYCLVTQSRQKKYNIIATSEFSMSDNESAIHIMTFQALLFLHAFYDIKKCLITSRVLR